MQLLQMHQCCVAKYMVICVIGLSCIRYAVATHLGQDFCLLSRLELIPCDVTRRSRLPTANEVGIYPTRYRFRPNSIECRIIRNGPIFNSITQIANNVKLLYSPGSFTLPAQDYDNNLLVMYNIRCPQDNQIAYFVLNNITLEDRTCFDPNLGRMRCVDYIQVDPDTKSQETCGQDTSPFQSTLAFQNNELMVVFRTSGETSFPGFMANVICITPEDTNAEGCTDGVSGVPTGRKRRNSEELKLKTEIFYKKRRKLLAMLGRRGRIKRNCLPDHFSIAGRNLTTLVPFGVDLMYDDDIVTFQDSATGEMVDFTENKLLAPLGSISRLETLDVNGNLTGTFLKSALGDSGQLLKFPGLGQLFVMGRTAMYLMFPPDILPTEEEEAAILELTSMLFPPVGSATPLPPEFEELINVPPLPPKEINDIVYPCDDHELEKRQAPGLAQMNVDACNPVLREAARAVDQMTGGQP